MSKNIIIASRYKILKKLGEGGMAKVYLANDIRKDQEVAIKILKKENVNEKKIKDFKREAETLEKLNDKNIVNIYDVGNDDGVHYIVNEYVKGDTLKTYIQENHPLAMGEIISITCQILNGMAHAHKQGIVHKDIKSQNVLIDNMKNVKITDFGISDVIDEDITRTQSLMGTPQYVAPEILNRDDLTVQSDIYSIGILMYELFVGKAPFSGEKAAIIMIKQMNHPLPSITKERPDVTQAVENVVIKATAKKLENRYLTALEMREELTKALEIKDVVPKLELENDIVNEQKLEKTVIMDDAIAESTLGKKSRKRHKFLKILVTLLLISFATLMAFVVLKQVQKMPDIEGENYKTLVDENYKRIGNKNVTIEYQENENVPENEIISSTPKEDTWITSDTSVNIVVSSGKPKEPINDYVGDDSVVAQNQLSKSGYIVEIKEQSSKEKEGTVISQDPEFGSQIVEGETVTLYVSNGSYTERVPDFEGKSQDEVEKWGSENNIAVEINEVCSNKIDNGKVINHSPKKNDVLNNDESLKVNVSNGSCVMDSVTVSP